MFTYLLLNIFTFLFPAIQSFEKKVSFYKKWKYAFPAIGLVGVLFILWDYYFTLAGVWGFNEHYHLGLEIGGLPFEELLFFVTVPFACLFIFEILGQISWVNRLEKPAQLIWKVIWLGLVLGAILGREQIYTLVAFSGAAIILGLQLFVIKSAWMGRFLLAYAAHLVPFCIVNGVLTALPVVWYNDLENSGLRLGSIPLEDMVYSLMLFLLNATLYEGFQSVFSNKKSPSLGEISPKQVHG
ncbi:MAG: lycopene cyclase domain-containing protein [Bacteroidia bacterium]|nr:lycopene cyclase domain-containing protein [Bacteroidia bacterium]